MQQPVVPATIPYGEVSVAEARALFNANTTLVIVDVRTLEEYASGHIPGAIVIPVSELEERLDELSTEDDLLIYCRTGNRSKTAVNLLVANGYT